MPLPPRSPALAGTLAALSLLLAAAVPSAQAAATLAVADVSIPAARNATALPFTVTRGGDTGFAVSVHYATQDGTAQAGRDYTATSGVLTFDVGQTSATVSVPLTPKLLARQPRSFALRLSDAAALPGTGPVWSAAGVATIGPYAEGAAVADFNGDGKPDVVFTAFADATVHVLRNDSPAGAPIATFTPSAVLSGVPGPSRPAVADFNGDGKPDLVVPGINDGTLDVWFNTTPAGSPSITFANTPQHLTTPGAIQATAADIDGDGLPDVVVAAVTPAKVTVLLNRTPKGASRPTFAAPAVFAVGTNAYTYAMTTLDVDGDGRPDVAVSDLVRRQMAVFRNTTVKGGAATLAAPVAFATADGATGLASADLDGDGRPDLVSAENGATTAGTTWSVLLNRTARGSTTLAFAVDSQIGPAPYSVGVQDVDGDGKPDVVLASLAFPANVGDGGLAVYLNRTPSGATSATLTPYAQIPAGDEPHAVAIADFNGDGRVDFATSGTESSLASLFFSAPPIANPQVKIGDATGIGTIVPRTPAP